MMFRLVLAAAALVGALPAAAQAAGGAWKAERERITVRAAGIGLPTRAAGVALTKTGESSNGGKALDNYAQYESGDGKVFATAFVYRPTYADAALAAYATRQAIAERFGALAPTAEGSVPFAGRAGGAIRQVYTGSLRGEATTTAAAFARVGGWLVKLRATGPATRAGEVTAALDALIAGATVGRDTPVYPAQPLRFGTPCPAAERRAPRIIRDGDSGAALLLAGLSGGSVTTPDTKTRIDDFPGFPANGAAEACVRGTMTFGARRIELIQPARQGDPAIVLALMDDACTTVAVERSLVFAGYTVKRYTIGLVEVGARIDRQPTAAQLARWLTTAGAPELAITSSTSVAADGNTQVTIDPGALK